MTPKLTMRLRPPDSPRWNDLNHATAHMRSALLRQSSRVSSGFSNLRTLLFGKQVALPTTRSWECNMIATVVPAALRRSQ